MNYTIYCQVGHQFYWVYTYFIKKNKRRYFFMYSRSIMQFKYATLASGLRREKEVVSASSEKP